MPKSHTQVSVLASSEDIRNLLGDLDDHVILDILALKPTIAQVEEAALRVEGEGEVFADIRPASEEGVVAQIVELASADEFEEPGVGHSHP